MSSQNGERQNSARPAPVAAFYNQISGLQPPQPLASKFQSQSHTPILYSLEYIRKMEGKNKDQKKILRSKLFFICAKMQRCQNARCQNARCIFLGPCVIYTLINIFFLQFPPSQQLNGLIGDSILVNIKYQWKLYNYKTSHIQHIIYY